MKKNHLKLKKNNKGFYNTPSYMSIVYQPQATTHKGHGMNSFSSLLFSYQFVPREKAEIATLVKICFFLPYCPSVNIAFLKFAFQFFLFLPGQRKLCITNIFYLYDSYCSERGICFVLALAIRSPVCLCGLLWLASLVKLGLTRSQSLSNLCVVLLDTPVYRKLQLTVLAFDRASQRLNAVYILLCRNWRTRKLYYKSQTLCVKQDKTSPMHSNCSRNRRLTSRWIWHLLFVTDKTFWREPPDHNQFPDHAFSMLLACEYSRLSSLQTSLAFVSLTKRLETPNRRGVTRGGSIGRLACCYYHSPSMLILEMHFQLTSSWQKVLN